MSFPTSMHNIVDNLQSTDSLTYVDIRSYLPELPGSTKLSSKRKALKTRSHNGNKFHNKEKTAEKPNPT